MKMQEDPISTAFLEPDSIEDSSKLVYLAKRILKSSGGSDVWAQNLTQSYHLVSRDVNPDPVVKNVLIETWMEEVIKFLVLKTLLEDFTEPCQLSPGFAVEIGWKALISLPAPYDAVCKAIGSEGKFDHDPGWFFAGNKTAGARIKHLLQRHNATLREYEKVFDSKPPTMFWSLEPPRRQVPVEEEKTFIGAIEALCCGDLHQSSSFDKTRVYQSI